MLDSLSQYLKTSTTPDFQAAVEEAFELFERFGLENQDIGFEEILMTANDEGEGEVTIRINSLVEELQDHVLTQMQIKLMDEVSVSEANMVLRALKAVETTEMNAEILDICREVHDPIEALAEIINRLTGREVERIIVLLEEVSKPLIAKIEETVSKHVLERREVIDVSANTEMIAKFKRYREAMDNQRLFIYDMIQGGVPLNQPYEIYHGKIMAQIQGSEEYEQMPLKQRQIKIAVQICAGLVVASDTQNGGFRPIVQQQLERTFTDIDMITPIYKEIDLIMTKFHALITSGIAKVG